MKERNFPKAEIGELMQSIFLKIFPADSLRYTLAANLPENRDTDFQWKEFQAKNNSELAAIFGNFINRTFTFAHKHFDGKVPPKGEP